LEQSDCVDCGVGQHAPSEALAACVNCPKGKYQHDQGKFDCITCQAGTFQANVGKITCPTCPACTDSVDEASSCFTLLRNCQVSVWTAWGSCTESCGDGTIERTRSVTVNPVCGGVGCPSLTSTATCLERPCLCSHVVCAYEAHACTTYTNFAWHQGSGILHDHRSQSDYFDDSTAARSSTVDDANYVADGGNAFRHMVGVENKALSAYSPGSPNHVDSAYGRGDQHGTQLSIDTHNANIKCGDAAGGVENSIRVYHSKQEREINAASHVDGHDLIATNPDGTTTKTVRKIEGHHCKMIGGSTGTCTCRCHRVFMHAYNPHTSDALSTGSSKFAYGCGPKDQSELCSHDPLSFLVPTHAQCYSDRNLIACQAICDANEEAGACLIVLQQHQCYAERNTVACKAICDHIDEHNACTIEEQNNAAETGTPGYYHDGNAYNADHADHAQWDDATQEWNDDV